MHDMVTLIKNVLDDIYRKSSKWDQEQLIKCWDWFDMKHVSTHQPVVQTSTHLLCQRAHKPLPLCSSPTKICVYGQYMICVWSAGKTQWQHEHSHASHWKTFEWKCTEIQNYITTWRWVGDEWPWMRSTAECCSCCLFNSTFYHCLFVLVI